MFAKGIACFLLYVLTIALSIAIMIYGWGLTPQNWWLIIGGSTVGYLLIEIMKGLARD